MHFPYIRHSHKAKKGLFNENGGLRLRLYCVVTLLLRVIKKVSHAITMICESKQKTSADSTMQGFFVC